MVPIRVCLVGLSSTAKTSWAAEGHLPYLLSSRGKSRYTLTALLNSSVSAAERAIASFNLPSTTKAYGNPDDVANDIDIDLVVVNTRVDVHYSGAEPSLRKGKAVFVEWPLAESYERAVELTQNKPVPDSIIGLQGRVSPPVATIREILASGRLGKILATDVEAYSSLAGRGKLPEGLTYFADRKVGGNPINIAVTHTLDYVQYTLGEFVDLQARMQIMRPDVEILGKEGEVLRTVRSDVPDFISLQGRIETGRADVADGATFRLSFRSGPPFKGQSAMQWRILGEKAELRLDAERGPWMGSESPAHPIAIEVHDFATNEVEKVDWKFQDWQEELQPVRGRSIGEVYDRYARWVEGGKKEVVEEVDQFPRLHDAVIRHAQLKKIWEQFDAQAGL